MATALLLGGCLFGAAGAVCGYLGIRLNRKEKKQ